MPTIYRIELSHDHVSTFLFLNHPKNPSPKVFAPRTNIEK